MTASSQYQNDKKCRYISINLVIIHLKETMVIFSQITQEEAEAQGVKMVKSKSLDDEYEVNPPPPAQIGIIFIEF